MTVRKGRGGRFVSESSSSASNRTSSRARAASKTSWLVRESMLGGPIDGSVIPSYPDHISARIYNDPFTFTVMMCHNRASVVDSLRNWDFDPQSQRVYIRLVLAINRSLCIPTLTSH